MNRTELDYYMHWLISQAGSRKALAANLGISQSYLSNVLHFRREPGKKLLDAIGIKAEVTYEYITTPIDDVVRRVRGEGMTDARTEGGGWVRVFGFSC